MTDAVIESKETLRKRLRRYRPYFVAVSVLIALGLLLTFQHKPAWYRPVEPTKQVVERARRDAPNLIDLISDSLVRKKQIEVELHEDQVNEWLAALPVAWPDVREMIPKEISQPAVNLTDGGLRIGCHLESSGWKVIFGARIQVSLVEGGDMVQIRVGSVQAGSLPVPDSLLKPMVNRSMARERANAGRRSDSNSRTDEPLIRSADELFEGIRIENRFEWPNGRRMFRIEALSLGEKKIVLTLSPL